MTVREAQDGDYIEHGLALVAPGDYHMLLMADSKGYRIKLKQSPKVWYQRPAVDVLFKSAASIVTHRAVAAVLTGMGRDGAEGLLKLKSTVPPPLLKMQPALQFMECPKQPTKWGCEAGAQPRGNCN